MSGTIVIQTNASQVSDVTIRDMGIIIPNSGGNETFTDIGNFSDCKLSNNLRTLATDDAFGVGSSTLIITDGTNTIAQGEIDAFLDSLGETTPTNFGVLVTDPTTTPNDGDVYYNSAIDMHMKYDAGRSKWLSVETCLIQFGRNNNTGAGAFYRGIGNLQLTSGLGYIAIYDGTVVSLAYTRQDTDSATFEVTEGGSPIATLASTSTAGRNNALNADFSQDGVIGFRNEAGGNITSDVAGYCRIKWRAT